jgi:hypothetical protein
MMLTAIVERNFAMWMKSFLPSLLLLVSIGQAQVISGGGIKFGIVSSEQIFERGRSRSLAWDSYLDRDLNPRLGPQIGLFAQFLNTRHLTLQGEVSYLQKGAEEEIYPTRVGPDSTYVTGEPFIVKTFQFDYVAFSVLVQPKVAKGQIEPYILVGPSLHILIANRQGVYRDADSLTPSVLIGGGIEFKKLFEFPLLIEIRYSPDLKYFFENEYVKSKFQVWQVLLGIKLNR